MRLILPVFILLLLLTACTTVVEPDPALAAQVTPAQITAGMRQPLPDQNLVWGGRVDSVTNLRDRTLIEIRSYPLSRERKPLTDRPAGGNFVLEMEGFIEPAELRTGLLVTATGRFAGMLSYREQARTQRLPRMRGSGMHVWASAPAARSTRQRPDVRWNLGIGTHGSGVGVSIGL